MLLPLVAAGASIAAGVTAGGIVGGLMIAGGAMSGIGAITGNKSLSRFGAVLGLAGGVAGLATGAWTSAASTISEEAASASAFFDVGEKGALGARSLAGGGEALSGLAQTTTNAELGAAGASTPSFEYPDALANRGVMAGATGQPSTLGAAPTSGATTAGVAQPSTPSTVPTSTAPVGQAGAPVGQVGSGATPLAGTTSAATPAGTNVVAPGSTSQGLLSSLQSKAGEAYSGAKRGVGEFFDWATANDKNARITQAGAGLLSAGMGAYGQQEAMKAQIKMQEEALARSRARLNESLLKMGPMPTYQPPQKG
jgi:hypothetical protein